MDPLPWKVTTCSISSAASVLSGTNTLEVEFVVKSPSRRRRGKSAGAVFRKSPLERHIKVYAGSRPRQSLWSGRGGSPRRWHHVRVCRQLAQRLRFLRDFSRGPTWSTSSSRTRGRTTFAPSRRCPGNYSENDYIPAADFSESPFC